ncbi:MAG TPA: alpha/beta fold hydrolase [Terriglobales bacterium]|jgi:hypothetical protein
MRAVAALLFLFTLQGPAPDYATLGRQLVGEFAARQFGTIEASFSPPVAQALPEAKLTAIWTSILDQEGAFQSISNIKVVAVQGAHQVTLGCTFANGPLDVQASFDARGKVIGLFFRAGVETAAPWSPPDYAEPAKFHEDPVAIGWGSSNVNGTLTLPNGAGPFPAVILVGGSGSNGENETIGSIEVFKDLAWGLASRGVAVLRYPKSKSVAGQFTVKDEYTDEAAAAIALLGHQPGIDAKRIFLLGHSEGGYIAPRIAAKDEKSLAGIILAAANVSPLEKLIVDQVRYLAPLEGATPAQTDMAVAAAQAAAERVESPSLKAGDTVELAGSTMPASYFLDLREYHPAAVAAQLTIPILVLEGALDYQVPKSEFALWQRALASHKNASFHLYPSLTHLFTPAAAGETLSTPSDYQRPEHVDAAVVRDIGNWIVASGAAQ